MAPKRASRQSCLGGLFVACLTAGACGGLRSEREPPSPEATLQDRIQALNGGPGRIELSSGSRELVSVAVEDASCAGCPDGREATTVKA